MVPETNLLKTDHSQAKLTGDHSHSFDSRRANKPESSRADRRASFKVADISIPTGREEDWRFTPVSKLTDFFATEIAVKPVEISLLSGAKYVQTLARDSVPLGSILAPGDRAAVTAWHNFTQAELVQIPAGENLPEPIHLQVKAPQEGLGVQHIFVQAQTQSQGVVVLDHRGSGKLNQTVEISVSDDAQLTVVSIQDWDDEAIHLANHRLEMGQNAKVRHIVVTLGGSIVRITPDAVFAAPGGDLEMLGLYFTDARQHQEHRLFVDHSVPNCKSRVTYKGALQGQEAHAVWVGDVLIGAQAHGTDTYELNRNLVLTEGAKADSVPNLEIQTGEIEGAGHASATGRFDDLQLFYLQSRGIPVDLARRLVVRGFFAELINQIEVSTVRERLLERIEAELDATQRNDA